MIRFADLTLKSAKFMSESHKGSVVKLKANCLEGVKVVFFCKLERLKSGTFLEVFFFFWHFLFQLLPKSEVFTTLLPVQV